PPLERSVGLLDRNRRAITFDRNIFKARGDSFFDKRRQRTLEVTPRENVPAFVSDHRQRVELGDIVGDKEIIVSVSTSKNLQVEISRVLGDVLDGKIGPFRALIEDVTLQRWAIFGG